jgi:hypothetical protein
MLEDIGPVFVLDQKLASSGPVRSSCRSAHEELAGNRVAQMAKREAVKSLRSGSLIGGNEVGLTASKDHVSKHDRVKGQILTLPPPAPRVLKGRHE